MAANSSRSDFYTPGQTRTSAPAISPASASAQTPIDLKLQSKRDIKIVKNHCVFYDLLMESKIDELLKSDLDKSGKKKNITKSYLTTFTTLRPSLRLARRG